MTQIHKSSYDCALHLLDTFREARIDPRGRYQSYHIAGIQIEGMFTYEKI